MLRFFSRIKTNYRFLGTILLYIIAFVLMAFMMPRERKFTYEFYKGRPWQHGDYTAKFSFPIYKTQKELRTERDSALADLKSYFKYDAYQFAKQLKSFKDDFNDQWVDYSVKEFNIPTADKYTQQGNYPQLHKLQKYYRHFIDSLFEKVYLQGVVEMPEAENLTTPVTKIIVLVRGNIAENKALKDLYTPKTAYEYIRSAIENDIKNKKSSRAKHYINFLNRFEIDKYIEPNVHYNAEATERERKSRIDEISLTKGLVQEGELIISNGQIVTPEKYQVLQSLKIEYEKLQGNVRYQWVQMGKWLLLFISLFLIYMFFYNFRREVLRDIIKSSFILFMVVLMVFVATTISKMNRVSFYIIPFTILPIIIRTFYDERIAVFVHVITMLIVGFIAPNSYEFVVLNTMAGIVAIFSLTNLYRRSRFFLASLFVFITYSLVYFGISVVQEGSFSNIDWDNFYIFFLNGVFTLPAFLLIYVFEKTFGFLSDTTLMELADTNQPLLRKMAEVAPGTFQHSLQVASLSEEAIHRIGGNPLLIRTGALYHDIGKMFDPIYFIENQTTGINPHDNIGFAESARIIIDHVIKGVELAKKNKLPAPITDFIRTHHGTTTVQYFYRSYIKTYPEKEVDLKNFMYPGPKPSSKEMAVLMMADSVEAASRSLKEYSQESISALVEKIISSQLNEGQFEEAAITYKDITNVKEVFKTRLKNIYHARISYPK